MMYRIIFTVDVDALDGREAETKAREAVEGFPTNNEQVYAKVRALRSSDEPAWKEL